MTMCNVFTNFSQLRCLGKLSLSVPFYTASLEPITKQPTLTYNSTWQTPNDSCTVFLECSAPSDSGVDYKWTVRNKTISGSRLQYILSVEDGDTDFTCMISNNVSKMSASQTVTCKQGMCRVEIRVYHC